MNTDLLRKSEEELPIVGGSRGGVSCLCFLKHQEPLCLNFVSVKITTHLNHIHIYVYVCMHTGFKSAYMFSRVYLFKYDHCSLC